GVGDSKSRAADPRRETGTATVERVSDAARFGAMRGEWNELLADSRSANPFLTWEWLHTWWKHFGAGPTLHILTVRAGEGGRLVAAAPLRVAGGPLSWLSRLEFLGTGAAGSDYLDVIVRAGYEQTSLGALAAHLASRQLALRL